MAEQDVYNKLAEKYGRGGFQHFIDILKALMNPEEAQLILEMSEPVTAKELAERLGKDEKSLAEKLDNMAKRGIIFRGKTQFIAWRDSHQLNARPMHSGDQFVPPDLLRLRSEDLRYAGDPFAEINGWLKRYETTGIPLLRVIPARKAIAASPKIKPDQVLWYENIEEMIRRQPAIGLTDCNCRRIYHRCDKPVKTCFHFGQSEIDYEADRGGRMKAITAEEAMAVSDMAEEIGLVHSTPVNNAGLAGVICNCCNDCCSTYEPALHSGKVQEVSAPSRFGAVVDQNLCTGCQTCLDRCPFNVIEMEKIPGSKKMKAKVDPKKCMGCGVCVITCKPKALTLEIVRPPEHIPPKPANAPARGNYDLK